MQAPLTGRDCRVEAPHSLRQCLQHGRFGGDWGDRSRQAPPTSSIGMDLACCFPRRLSNFPPTTLASRLRPLVSSRHLMSHTITGHFGYAIASSAAISPHGECDSSGYAHNRRRVQSTNRGFGMPRTVTENLSLCIEIPERMVIGRIRTRPQAFPPPIRRESGRSKLQIDVFRCVGSSSLCQCAPLHGRTSQGFDTHKLADQLSKRRCH